MQKPTDRGQVKDSLGGPLTKRKLGGSFIIYDPEVLSISRDYVKLSYKKRIKQPFRAQFQ